MWRRSRLEAEIPAWIDPAPSQGVQRPRSWRSYFGSAVSITLCACSRTEVGELSGEAPAAGEARVPG